jgi:IS5 family transposase
MPKQPALPRLSHTMKKKVTRREAFLSEMEAVVPWTRLLALIEPHYPKAGPQGGRPPMPLESDAAGPFPSAVVCAQRSDGGGEPP